MQLNLGILSIFIYYSGPLKDYETIAIANMINRLHVFFPAMYMTSLPSNIVQAYLVELTKMACIFMERAAQEELVSFEITFFDNLL